MKTYHACLLSLTAAILLVFHGIDVQAQRVLEQAVKTTAIAIYTSGNGDGSNLNLAMEQWKDQSWHTFKSSWELDVDPGIFPLVTYTDPDPATYFAGGTGTHDNPYQLATAQHLDHIRLFPGGHYS